MRGLTRIDTHQHVLPPFYARQLLRRGFRPGGVDVPPWSPKAALRMMDRTRIRLGVLSVSDPGVRLGFLAMLTFPDVESALEEFRYTRDELHADGVVLLANAAGRYPGDPLFTPLLAELDRRGITVFVHPGTLPAEPVSRVPTFTLDYLLDTSRGRGSDPLRCPGRFPRIRFILARGGGFFPCAAHRILLTMIARETAHRKPLAALRQEHAKRKKLQVFRRFHWDTARAASPSSLPSLFDVAEPENITFGTDWPFTPHLAVRFITRELEHCPMPGRMRDAMDHENALRLFPRIRALACQQGWYERSRRRTCRNR